MTSHADAKAISRSFRALPDAAVSEGLFTSLEYLNRIGVALSSEKDINRLLETILHAAKTITNADGGTLYRVFDDQLKFEIVLNDSLKIAMGGTTGNEVLFQDALRRGYRVSPAGDQDNHNATWGASTPTRTVVQAAGLTR